MDPYAAREAMAAIPLIERNLSELDAERVRLQVAMKARGEELDRLAATQKEDAARHTTVAAEANALRRILAELADPRRY